MTPPLPLDPRARAAWPEVPPAMPVGSWLVCVAGELRAEMDGSITPRPSALPWSRLSVAANPCAGRSR